MLGVSCNFLGFSVLPRAAVWVFFECFLEVGQVMLRRRMGRKSSITVGIISALWSWYRTSRMSFMVIGS